MIFTFPDKPSVYAEFKGTESDPTVSLIPEISVVVKIPRLDLAFKAEISQTQKDIYLISNSHSGGWANILVVELPAEHSANEQPKHSP